MSNKYILDANNQPVLCEDWMEWGRWREGRLKNPLRWRVGLDNIGNASVSTVFLGVDHRYGDGPPILWETMVFNGPLDGEQDRYTSHADAVAGHAAMDARVRAAQTT